MAIGTISNGEGGASARAKINATIGKANEVDGKASKAELIAFQTSLSADLSRDDSRPGDAPTEFSGSLAGGRAENAASFAAVQTTFDDDGAVIRLTGNAIAATRTLFALEPGREYRARFAFRRRTNTPDPDNDAVRLAVAWYDQAKNRLAGENSFTVIEDVLGLNTGAGRQTRQAVIGRAAGDNIDVVAPANARYARLYVHVFGDAHRTDVEVLDWRDVTDALLWSPDTSTFENRVGALETINAGERLDELEQEVATPSVLRFRTRGDALAATIGVFADVIETMGLDEPGDGLGAQYKRSEGEPAEGDKFQSADGAWWDQVPDVGLDRLTEGTTDLISKKQTPRTIQIIVTADSQPLTQQHVDNFGQIRAHLAANYPKHDAFFFLGDMVDTGDNSNPMRTVDYTFDDWIADVSAVTDRERLFSLPGNHDVDRDQDGSNPVDNASFNSYLKTFEREFYYVLWGNMLFVFMGHMSRNGQGTITDYMVEWCKKLVESHQWCAYIQINSHQPRPNTTDGSATDFILQDGRFGWVGEVGYRVDAWFSGHTGKDLNNPAVVDHVTLNGCTYVAIDSNSPYSNDGGTARRHDLSYIEMEILEGSVEIAVRRNNVNAANDAGRISKAWTIPLVRPVETSTYPRHDGRTQMNQRYDVFMKAVEAYVPVARNPDGTAKSGPTVAARFAVEDRANDNVNAGNGAAIDLEVPGAPSGFATGVGSNSPQLNHAHGYGARIAAERVGNGERNFGSQLNLYASILGSDEGDEYTVAQLRKILSLGTAASIAYDGSGNEVWRWNATHFIVGGRLGAGGTTVGAGGVIAKTGEFRSFMAGTGLQTAFYFYNNAGVSPSVVGNISHSGSTTTYGTSSDAALKVKKGEFTFDQARQVLDLIRFHNFEWKSTGADDHGVFAQELFDVYPKAVVPGGWRRALEDGSVVNSNEAEEHSFYVPWTVDYSTLVTVLGRCVQEVISRVDRIEAALAGK